MLRSDIEFTMSSRKGLSLRDGFFWDRVRAFWKVICGVWEREGKGEREREGEGEGEEKEEEVRRSQRWVWPVEVE